MSHDTKSKDRRTETQGLASALGTWPKPLRILVGLFFAAALGTYFSKIVYTLVGAGPNSMAMWKDAAYSILILMMPNLLAYRKRAFWWANGILAIVLFVIVTLEVFFLLSPSQYLSSWKGYLFALSGPAINAWLFSRFCTAVID